LFYLGFLLVLFTFVGNKFNRASATKRSEKGIKIAKEGKNGMTGDRITMPEMWHDRALASARSLARFSI